MDNWNEQLFEMIGRLREQNRMGSRTAAVVKEPCGMMVANNPNRISKAASVAVQRVNKVKIIHDFISNYY